MTDLRALEIDVLECVYREEIAYTELSKIRTMPESGPAAIEAARDRWYDRRDFTSAAAAAYVQHRGEHGGTGGKHRAEEATR